MQYQTRRYVIEACEVGEILDVMTQHPPTTRSLPQWLIDDLKKWWVMGHFNSIVVTTSSGMKKGRKGDWVVKSPIGDLDILTLDEFTQLCEPIKPTAQDPLHDMYLRIGKGLIESIQMLDDRTGDKAGYLRRAMVSANNEEVTVMVVNDTRLVDIMEQAVEEHISKVTEVELPDRVH